MSKHLEALQLAIAPYRASLLQHKVYHQIDTLTALQDFASVHVFAVWDFMSLLKALQKNLTCVKTPWVPIGSANTRYLINEIVLGEESDIDQNEMRISHFELYLQAMNQMSASSETIHDLIDKIQLGHPVQQAIQMMDCAVQIKSFLQFTFEIVEQAPVYVQAAVFTFGREDLIPDMFTRLLEKLYATFPEKVTIFKYYIERHIEVDGGHHSQLALQMVTELCGEDDTKWRLATDAAITALKVRAALWDAVIAKK